MYQSNSCSTFPSLVYTMCLLVCATLLGATQNKHTPIFWQRIMASEMKVLTLVPEISHLAVDCSSVCLWSCADEAYRTTSSNECQLTIWQKEICIHNNLKTSVLNNCTFSSSFTGLHEAEILAYLTFFKCWNFIFYFFFTNFWQPCSTVKTFFYP